MESDNIIRLADLDEEGIAHTFEEHGCTERLVAKENDAGKTRLFGELSDGTLLELAIEP